MVKPMFPSRRYGVLFWSVVVVQPWADTSSVDFRAVPRRPTEVVGGIVRATNVPRANEVAAATTTSRVQDLVGALLRRLCSADAEVVLLRN